MYTAASQRYPDDLVQYFALTGRKQKVELNICVVHLIFAALPALSQIVLHNNPVGSHGRNYYMLFTGEETGNQSVRR